MSSLQLQPLEIKDFSGGETDYYIQGESHRYLKATNFVIENDKSLRTRPGSVGFDNSGNHLLPGLSRRIDAFVLFNNQNDLLVNQGRDILYLNSTPAWTSLTGPSGNTSLGAGDSYSSLSSSLWKDHLYLTNDAGPIPSKIYLDETGAYKVRTVGLPAPLSTPKYTEASLLAACIRLANELRTSMISHVNSYSNTGPSSGPVTGYLHGGLDKNTLSYFETQTWSSSDIGYDARFTGSDVPTPAPAATSEATLYTLVQALSKAYGYHGGDIVTKAFHFYTKYDAGTGTTIARTTLCPKGPYKRLGEGLPSTLTEAAENLDEIRQYWYWHQFGLYNHNETLSFTELNRDQVQAPEIGVIDLTGEPVPRPNYSAFLRYVNYLKYFWNNHAQNFSRASNEKTLETNIYNSAFHSQTNKTTGLQYTLCTLPDAIDLKSAYLIIYWIWLQYGVIHVNDSDIAIHTNFTMDTTAGSAAVTNSSVALVEGQWIVALTDAFNAPPPYSTSFLPSDYKAAQVTVGGATSGTLSKTLAATAVGASFQLSRSVFHGSYTSAAFTNTTTFSAPEDEFLADTPAAGTELPNSFPTSLQGWIDLAKSIFQALMNHVSNSNSHYTGVPTTRFLNYLLDFATDFYVPEVESVSYAFTYKYEYTTNNLIDFLNISVVTTLAAIETDKIYPIGTSLTSGIEDVPNGTVGTQSSVTITNLPVLSNTANTNYDTSNIEVQIYRTVDDGTTFYLADEVDNGTTSFADTIADSIDGTIQRLDTRETLYTTGGVVENTQPPQAKFLHILNDTAYYGYLVDDGQEFKNRILQAIPGSPDAAPSNFTDDLDDEIVGISSTRNNVIVFCKHSLYRLQGGFNNLGQGSIVHEKISDTLGCISSNSIVQTEIGVFFAGNDGFYYTTGFELIKVSLDKDLSYQKMVLSDQQKKRINGCYDRLNRRILWNMQSDPLSSDCDTTWVFYLNYGVKPSGTFTTWNNLGNWKPSASIFYKDKFIRGDTRGLVFKHDDIYLTDPEVPSDVSTSLSTWNAAYIPFDYTSCAMDFGTIYQGQWVTKLHLIGENKGNVNIQVNSIADNRNENFGKQTLAPIKYLDNMQWGDATINWGDEDTLWEYDGKLDAFRRFTSRSLRSQLKQVQFVPASVGVYRYDDYPPFSYVSTNGTTNVITLATPTGWDDIDWPLDVVGMSIALSDDDYDTEFPITAVSGADITVTDTDNVLATTSGLKWVIRGYQKEVGFSLVSYVIHFANLGFRGETYKGKTDRGENA